MEAREFWLKFQDKIKEHREVLEKRWLKDKAFTKSIKQVITEVIKEKYPSENFVVQPEYYNIDIVGWEQKKSAEKEYLLKEDERDGYLFEKYAWNLSVAVEHENKKELWMDEVVKLAYIYCDLRVVIGYFPYKIKGKQQSYLDEVASVLAGLGCRENLERGDFLVILGDADGDGMDGFGRLVYTAYLYRDGSFSPL